MNRILRSPLSQGEYCAGEPLTLDALRRNIGALTGTSPADIDEECDLVALGLDSLGVARLASGLRFSGVDVTFEELLERRTLHDWWSLVSARPRVGDDPSLPMTTVDPAAPFRLSSMQHAYWMGRHGAHALSGPSHYYFEFEGPRLDGPRLEAAVWRLIERHAALRTRILDDGRQQVMERGAWSGLRVHDLRGSPSQDAAAWLLQIREQEMSRRLDVEHGVGFDVHLTYVSNDRTHLHVNIDMLVCDALSFRILFTELAAIYSRAASSLPPLAYDYASYLRDRDASRAKRQSSAREFWHASLGQLTGAPRLPLVTLPAMIQCAQITRREIRVSRGDWEVLANRAAAHGVSLPMVFLTAYALVLAEWSTSRGFVINVPLFQREPLHPDVERMVGEFTGSVLLPVELPRGAGFAHLARDVQRRFADYMRHSSYPGVEVLRDLARVDPDAARTAPCVVFTSAIGLGPLFGDEALRHFGRLAWMSSRTANVWLDCQVVELDGGLLVNWDAVAQLFPTSVLDAMFSVFGELVSWLIAADWHRAPPVRAPRAQLLAREGAGRPPRVRPPRLLHSGFVENVGRHAHRIALAWGTDGSMTYTQLGDAVAGVARALSARGVVAGDIVAVTMPKRAEQIVAVLAILCVGCAYLPVSVDNPAKRRARLYDSAGARIVVTDCVSRDALEWPPFVKLIAADEPRVSSGPLHVAAIDPSALAYVIFTSGSTGEPKGVAITHGAAMNTIEDVVERYDIGPDDRVLSVSSLDFDWTVADIFELLTVGGAVVLPEESARRDADRWVELAQTWGITLWQSVPALFDMWLLSVADRHPRLHLRLVMLGGDWVGLDLHGRLQAVLPGCRLIALGGITETSIHITVHEITGVPHWWRSIPYGVPLTNVKCRVVDDAACDRPDWVTGELWVGGAGLARGYLNAPELTERKFVMDQGERWYRSGDLARYWPDGTLEFLGRNDSQVEIRGHRIELGEVRGAILEHPHVSQAFVTVLAKPERRLAAAIVGRAVTADEVRAFLETTLPRHLIPAQIAMLDGFPLTENGKIHSDEITRLLALNAGESDTQRDPPRSAMERLLADIWRELLQVPSVSRNDSFFSLGGDSLVATRLVVRLRQAGIDGLRLSDLFSTPRLREVAAHLRERGAASAVRELTVHPEHAHEPFPLTEIQRAYWLGRQAHFVLGNVGSYWYWEFDGVDVDLQRLQSALNVVIGRHPMLRTVIETPGVHRLLERVPQLEIALSEAGGDEELCLSRFREDRSHRILDPARWPPLEVGAIRYGERRTRIGFGIDYLFADALSIMTLFAELSLLYRNPGAALPPLEPTFRDYVLGVVPDASDVAEDSKYWSESLAELPPAPALPLAVLPTELRHPRFVRREMEMSLVEWGTIKSRARAHDLTPSSVLSAAYAQVLCRWSGQRAVTLNFTLFDRAPVHEQVNRVVGDFTSLMLVPYVCDPHASWAASVRALQGKLALGLQHRAVSALSVMTELTRRCGRESLTMPVVFTSMLGVADELVALSTPFGDYVGGVSQTPQVWLDNQVVEVRGRLLVNWDSVAELFPLGLLDEMFTAYGDLLRRLASPDFDWEGRLTIDMPPPQRRVRETVNATSAPSNEALLHAAFFQRARSAPDRPALLWGRDGILRYGELAERALSIAGALVECGVRPGDRVAVSLPKGPEQIAAVLGILAAGAAYVPIGVDQPARRREEMCQRAGIQVQVTASFPECRGAPLVRPVSIPNDALAYVIFTSGSTGRPKGVQISHRAVVNTVVDINERYEVTESDRTLALSALDFDLSVYDIFGPLSVGGSVVLAEEESRRDALEWWRLVQTWGVTIWNSVPALLGMLATVAHERPMLASLRLALVSGDWVPLGLPARLQTCTKGCRFVALGGATEAAIWSNFHEVRSVEPHWRSIPYGRPLRNQKFRVVDASGSDCPDWVAGELWIGGLGVALGYIADPTRTTERFAEHAGARWFRTGDVGRYWPDGTLEFLGRLDHQVKLRGHRIELGELEATAELYPGVARALAAVYGSGHNLALAVIPRPGIEIPSDALREFLAARLPSYMLPQSLIPLDEPLLTSNGKLDRAALSRLAEERAADAEAEVPPQGEVEEQIASLWGDLLQVRRIGRDNTFFDLGGNSVLATEFVERARRQLGVEIGLRQMLECATVRGLAAVVGGSKRALGPTEEGTI